MPIAPEHLHLAYEGPFYAYLYGRASRDPKKKGRSVNSQITEGRSVCDTNGWPIIREFRDVDRSASRYAKKTREDYEEMLEGIENGIPRILVAFEASRYYRDLDAYVRLRRACMQSGVLLCYDGAVYDLSKRGDRKATAMDAINAEDEAEGIQLRNARTVRQNAAKGGPHGRILWGYTRRYDPDSGELIGQFPHPERADVVKLVYERFLAGSTIYSITKHLQTRDAVEDGRTWEYFHVYEMLRNPSYAGQRVFQGKVHGKALWKAIVSEDKFDAVQKLLAAEDRAESKDWSVQHLLAGIARCGRCPSDDMNPPPPLRSITSDGYPTYVCKMASDVSIRCDKLEAYVEEAVLDWLSSKAASAAFDPTKGQEAAAKARSRYDSLHAQLEEARSAASRFDEDGRPELSVASLASIEGRLQPMIDDAKKQLRDVPAVPTQVQKLLGCPRELMEDAWDALVLEQQRALLRTVVNIRLFRASRPGVRTVEPGRVQLTFYGEKGFSREWRRGPVTVPPQRADAPDPETR
jgi:DNA invertase Pin-like site-specific DNA recombinase